jgi:hypothetical protein
VTLPAPHIYRWDLDKTYLDTDFDSLGGLVRTALQRPADKRNIPGSSELLRELRVAAAGNALIYFISGSPRQMRGVLTEKLQLDGVHFDGFILKDNLRNLMQFRFRAVKEQIGYKLPSILEARALDPKDSDETLFGDDAERDAFVYSLYADLLARRVDRATLHAVLDQARVYPDARDAIDAALQRLPRIDPVRRIIIHLDRKSPPMHFDVYGPRVVPVYNYFQASLVLHADGRLGAEAVARIGTALIERYDYTVPMLVRSFEDALRRGLVNVDRAGHLGEQASSVGVRPEVVALFAAEALRFVGREPLPRSQAVPDYPALLSREHHRHQIEKARRRRISHWLGQ